MAGMAVLDDGEAGLAGSLTALSSVPSSCDGTAAESSPLDSAAVTEDDSITRADAVRRCGRASTQLRRWAMYVTCGVEQLRVNE